MFRLIAISLLILLVGSSASAAKAKPCAPFDLLALEKLPTRIDPDSADRMQDIWAKWSNEPQGGYWPITDTIEPQFRIETTVSGLVPNPQAYEVRGVRASGRWRLEARSKAIRHRAERWSRWRRVAVTPKTARALNSSISDRCLWSAPSFLAASLPLAAGGWVPSYDGPTTYFDVRAFGHTWRGLQVSWTVGAPATLRRVAMLAAFGAPLHQLIPGEPELSASGLRFRDEAGTQPWDDKR